MNPDWTYVKQATLWPYEELLKKLDRVLTYPVLRLAYNQTMPQARVFAQRLFADRDMAGGEFPAPILATLDCLQEVGVRDWADLLERVATREACVRFVEQNHLIFEELIDVLRYLLRWAFPFHTASRELLDHDNPQEMSYYALLKEHGLMCSFDLLEQGCTRPKRASLAACTGLPLEFVTGLVHRADIARLPYVRRKTILPLCGAGYDTLANIAAADLLTMEADMRAYFQRAEGKAWDDFKSVIVLRGLVIGAKALPRILRS